MSFHGGLLGVILALAWFAQSRRQDWLAITDFVAPLVPPGLAHERVRSCNSSLCVYARPDPVLRDLTVFPSPDFTTSRSHGLKASH